MWGFKQDWINILYKLDTEPLSDAADSEMARDVKLTAEAACVDNPHISYLDADRGKQGNVAVSLLSCCRRTEHSVFHFQCSCRAVALL